MRLGKTKIIFDTATNPLYAGRIMEISLTSFHFSRIDDVAKRLSFRIACRQVLNCYIDERASYGQAINPGTGANFVRSFRVIVRWMIANDMCRFADLTSLRLTELVLDIVEEKALSKKSAAKYLALLRWLWEIRFRYPASLRVDPESVIELRTICENASDNKTWGAIPLEEAAAMLNAAIDWHNRHSETVLSIARFVAHHRGSLVGMRLSEMRVHMRSVHARIPIEDISDDFFSELGLGRQSSGTEILSSAIRRSIGSVLTICLLFTGMRIGEILALQIGCYQKRTSDDTSPLWFIEGVQAKRGGVRRDWVVPVPVVAALEFMGSLQTLLLHTEEDNYLFSIPPGYAILPPPHVNVSRLWPSKAADLFVEFAVRVLGASGASVHPHLARKTFARFVTLRNKDSLEALAHHYGHLYTAVLDGAYVGIDHDLEEMLSKEMQAQVAQAFEELSDARAIGGRAGEKLRQATQTATPFQGSVALQTMVKRLITEGVVMVPCDWGYCVYAPEFSACGGTRTGPNLRAREPSVCASCDNFVVTERNQSWWEQRTARELTFVTQPGIPEQARLIAEQRLRESNKVLEWLLKAESNAKI